MKTRRLILNLILIFLCGGIVMLNIGATILFGFNCLQLGQGLIFLSVAIFEGTLIVIENKSC